MKSKETHTGTSKIASCTNCGVKLKYRADGSWLIVCRTCTTPHRIRNGELKMMSDKEVRLASTKNQPFFEQLQKMRLNRIAESFKLEANSFPADEL